MKILNIKDSNFELLLLIEIIKKMPNFQSRVWYLEEIEAYADLSSMNTNMLELEKECGEGDYGKKVNYSFLESLILKIENLDSLVILSGEIFEDKLNFKDYKSIYKNVEFVIEYFDSSEWNISSFDIKFIKSIKELLDKNKIEYNYLEI